MKMIESTTNQFGGVIPKPEALPENAEDFRRQLGHALTVWKQQGFRLVWLQIPITKSNLIPIAVEAGFGFHHCHDHQPEGQRYLMLTYRLVEDALIPPYASHYIGAGGVVLNERRELLVVSERYRRDKANPAYKLPGGALHEGEYLVDGIIREVYEETGIQTRFESVVCFRHMQGYRYSKSDIYFVCRLSPLSHEISIQDEEIEACLWMPLANYLQREDVALFNKQIVQAALGSPGLAVAWLEGYDNSLRREFFRPDDS